MLWLKTISPRTRSNNTYGKHKPHINIWRDYLKIWKLDNRFWRDVLCLTTMLESCLRCFIYFTSHNSLHFCKRFAPNILKQFSSKIKCVFSGASQKTKTSESPLCASPVYLCRALTRSTLFLPLFQAIRVWQKRIFRRFLR